MSEAVVLSGDRGLHFLSGGGEMGARMRARDWAATALGPPEGWPQNLKSAIALCLGSRFPTVIWWGREGLIQFYNDGYISFLGSTKHPAFLGRSGRECWSEIWETMGPLWDKVFATGEADWFEDFLYVINRALPQEEIYVTFSYGAIHGEAKTVDGIFCSCYETTAKVVGARRLGTLRRLGEQAMEAVSVADACARAEVVLGENRHDIPFARIYLLDSNGGFPTDAVAPDTVASVLQTRRPALASGLELPGGAWPEPTTQAVLLPLFLSTHDSVAGLIALGVSPRRPLDQEYTAFFDLIAGHVSTAMVNARAREDERRRAEALAEIDRAKTVFFSNVSHELRTPLTLLLGPVEEALQDAGDPLSSTQRQRQETVHRNALRLLKLVNSLLDFSRLEAGRVQASYEPTDIASFTGEISSAFRSLVERAGLRLTLDCPPLQEPVFVDRQMWEKIVLNLVSNAFKFTFEGEIAVRVEASPGFARLIVRDTGTGIDEKHLPHIFERFYRVEGARGRTYEGTGIGLALVRELVRLHGGSVSVESECGKGTTFTVDVPTGRAHLPQDRIQAGPYPASTAVGAEIFVDEAAGWIGETSHEITDAPFVDHAGDAAASSTRLLVADDNADMRAYLGRLLSPLGTVEVVKDGREALAAIERRIPDLVLSDVMMPNFDGFGLVRALRENPRTRTLPVVLLSARAGEESRVEGASVGADDYIVKPFSARELVARVGAQLQLARQRREHAEALLKANRTLAEADRRKDEFLAMLSHELRNPLSVIGAASEILQRAGADETEVQRARDAIQRQVHHMSRLVDDLLDASRVTQGKIALRTKRVRVADVLTHAVEATSPLIRNLGHRLFVSPPLDSLVVDGDAVRLTQIVSNLLTNAAKYTQAGGEICVSADGRGPRVEIRVTDNGQGIDAALLPRVFDLFVQGDHGTDRAKGGLGIGLTMARSLTELHGGTIEAHSDGPGTGSEFVIRLPLAQAEPARPASDEQRSEHRVSRRILVVDDNRDAAEMMRTLLELDGHEVTAVHDGGAAVERAMAWRPDVALIDLGMPAMDGFDVARRLRAELSLDGIVLVALTGYGQEEDVRRSREAGFDYHVTKAADLGPLLHVLDQIPVDSQP